MKVRFIVVTEEPRYHKTIFDIETGHIYTEETFEEKFLTSFRELEQSKNVFVISVSDKALLYKIQTYG